EEVNGRQRWVCEAQAQEGASAGVITAYAVGIKDLKSNSPVPMRIVKVTSTTESQPLAAAGVIADFMISGCGGRVEPTSETAPPLPPGTGNDHQFLTAVLPYTPPPGFQSAATECRASSSDYGGSAPGTVNAYAINLLLDRDILSRAYTDAGTTMGRAST